jgi:hypothetical protein
MKKCFQCGAEGSDICGYVMCEACKSKMGLFTDKTVQKHNAEYAKKGLSYEQEVKRRLDVMEKDYLKKRIKLLSILESLKKS